MTTITYRDGMMAADTTTFFRGIAVGTSHKIELIEGYLVGCAGDASSGKLFKSWFVDRFLRDVPEKAAFAHDSEINALTIAPDGRVTCWDIQLEPIRLKAQFHAIGSGADVALGAMAMGANARQAVEIAMRFDAHTRGKIDVLRLPAL